MALLRYHSGSSDSTVGSDRVAGGDLVPGVLERAEMILLDACIREAHVEAHGLQAQVVPVGVVVYDAAEVIADLGK
ncbi:hypothetical protein KJ359_007018 [Pestalotiopsis sp. 9143b]|nr:hypothetical protein KJ359_007018 [Pestalotiopsis sp. 9143b]